MFQKVDSSSKVKKHQEKKLDSNKERLLTRVLKRKKDMQDVGTSFEFFSLKRDGTGASLVAQWLRICLPMQGTRVRALVWEDPTCRGAAGPVSHNC